MAKSYTVKVLVEVELSFESWEEAFMASMDTSYICEEIADAVKDGSYEIAPIAISVVEAEVA